MVFSSYIFMFVFLPIVLVSYYGLSKTQNIKNQHLFLVLASLLFYGYFNIYYLFIIISSIIVNYFIAFTIKRGRDNKKIFLILGILFNIGLLAYFKYYDFFVDNINIAFNASYNLKYLILPLGISFFTFQQFSFLLSIYKQEEVIEGFIDYCLFVTFFPQLVAGPIVTYSEMIPQFKENKRRYYNPDNFSIGVYMFTIGLFKKIVLADTFALFVDNGYNIAGRLDSLSSLLVILAYTFQIYFDFCGYSEMAIGLGKMFNIDLPINFNLPYLSASIREFWTRWHITLGHALSQFVYKPLGGNRKGKIRTYINLMLTFLVSGFWHGAAWTFIVWGGLHGAMSVLEREFDTVLDKINHKVRIGMTFFAVAMTWVLFRATSFNQAMTIYNNLFSFDLNNFRANLAEIVYDGILNFPTIVDNIYILMLTIFGFVIVFIIDKSYGIHKGFKRNKKSLYITALLFVISIIHLSRISTFIYFNF